MLMPRFDSVRLTNLTRAVLFLAGLVTFGSSGASQSTAIVDQANAPALQLAQVSTADRTSATPTRRALLIGVGEHLYNKVPDDRKRMGKKKSFPEDLGGAANDVEIIKDVLIRRFGFKPENIVTLTDSQATREAILAAMRQIVEDAGPAGDQGDAVQTDLSLIAQIGCYRAAGLTAEWQRERRLCAR